MNIELLDQLEREHREAEQIIATLESAESADEQRSLVERLSTALSSHMQTEESKVYPVLASIDAEMASEGDVEHDLTRDGLEQLSALIGAPGFGAAVAMVKAGVSHHVEDEETKAFPLLRAVLRHDPSPQMSKEQLYAIAAEARIEGRSAMSKDELLTALGR